MKEKELEINLDPCSEMTDEEILFWSTPYYEELQELRIKKEKHAKEKEEENG